MKARLALLATIPVLALAPLLAAAPASAAVPHMCKNSAPSLCTGSSVTTGNIIVRSDSSNYDNVSTSAYNNPATGNNIVTGTWPFTPGSGLNTRFMGDGVHFIDDNGTFGTACYGLNSGSTIVSASGCTTGGASHGTAWVHSSTGDQSGHPGGWVSVVNSTSTTNIQWFTMAAAGSTCTVTTNWNESMNHLVIG